MKENIFLNIIIIFSPNYEDNFVEGACKKDISMMEQFLVFYNSIKKNLKLIDYDISIVHFKDFNDIDQKKLELLDINIYKINTDDFKMCAINRYIVNTKKKGTHRLIAETDMILLKEPTFNWNVDFQMMYGGYTPFNIKTMEKIYKLFKIKKNIYIKNYNHNKELFKSYNFKKIDKSKLYPYFNNGLLLIKEDFAKKFYKKIISSNIQYKLDNEFDDLNNKKNNMYKGFRHFGGQVIYSLLLVELTDNWEPFEPGINYIPVNGVECFGKENIILIHYGGSGGKKKNSWYIKKIFPEYFTK